VLSAKISWDRGEVAPVPRSPEPRGNSNYGKCAQEKLKLTEGVHPTFRDEIRPKNEYHDTEQS
jgi:hypothetical protein